MRVAAPCWPMLCGLPVFLGQMLLAVASTHGWEQNSLRASSAQQQATTNMRVVGPVSDDMMQQAAYAGTPRHPQSTAQAAPQGAMFHGMGLRLPKMPFSRAEQTQTSASRRAPTSRVAAGQSPSMAPRSAARFATGQAVQPANHLAPRHAQGQSVPAPRNHSPAPALATTPSAKGPAGSVPKPAPLIAVEPRPITVAPDASLPMANTPAETAPAAIVPRPQSPADRLIVEAHELSSRAETVDDYTHVIETCRRTRASQPSEQVSRYASELAGWALNRRGQLKADAGQLREAMLDFDDAIRADPECWRAIHNRGVLLAQSGQFEKAFDDFNRTIHVNDEFAKAYSNRAALFVVAGDLLPAMNDYQRAIELEPNFAVAHRGRGRVCHLLGRLDDSIGHYDAAVQLAPDDAYAISSRADLLTDLGRYSEAARDYERSIELDPRSPEAYRGLAWLMATCPDDSIRNPARAMELAEFALRLDEKREPVGLDTLAAAQASAGDFAAAMQTLHKAIETAPEAERTVYQDRLVMYQHARPFRIAPVRQVAQASYEQ